jgi:hypothetical protein
MPSIKLVSRLWISVRINAISLRAFSKIMRVSSDMQRRQLGAITMARLLASILVIWTTSVRAKICNTVMWYSTNKISSINKGLNIRSNLPYIINKQHCRYNHKSLPVSVKQKLILISIHTDYEWAIRINYKKKKAADNLWQYKFIQSIRIYFSSAKYRIFSNLIRTRFTVSEG